MSCYGSCLGVLCLGLAGPAFAQDRLPKLPLQIPELRLPGINKPAPNPSPPLAQTRSPTSAQDAQLERSLTVSLKQPPASVARDSLCASVAAVDPAQALANALELAAPSLLGSGGPLEGIKSLLGAQDKSKLLLPVQTELKRQVWLPSSIEVEIGKRMLESAKQELVGEDDPRGRNLYRPVKPVFQKIVERLPADQPYAFSLYISNDAGTTYNAKALPGGFIIVNQALAKADRERIAAYLAHEIGHVVKRHQTMFIQAQLIDNVTSVDALRSLLQADHSSLLERVMASVNLSGTSFTRYFAQQELEADACSGKFLATADGVNGRMALERFIQDLESDKHAQAAMDPKSAGMLFQTLHPSYSERRAILEGSFRKWSSGVAATTGGSSR